MRIRQIPMRFKVALLAAGFVCLLVLSSGWYWFTVIKPSLQEDMQSLASSMASARASELALALDRYPLNNKLIIDELDAMLAYSFERTQARFFMSVDLQLSDEVQQRSGVKPQFSLGATPCKRCFYQDYPLYSPKHYTLIGVLTVAMSTTQTQEYIESLQRLMLIGGSIVFICLLFVLAIILNMTSAIDQLNRHLEDKVEQRTRSLYQEVEKRKQTQEKLHTARDEIQRLERSRIAKTLHDGVGQVLQAMRMGLQRLGTQVEDSHKQLVDELVDDTGEAISIVREFCSELRPLHLEKMTLAEALGSHLERLDRRLPDISLSLEDDNSDRVEISPLVKEQLFLVAVELVNNALKHSQARHIRVYLREATDQLRLRVEDDGRGFDMAALEQSESGLGLSLIHERCERINAELQIKTQPEQGVRALCILPLQQPTSFTYV